MSATDGRKDLIVLVADRNMEHALRGLIGRHRSIGIRPITFDIRIHPERDSGCRTGGIEFLTAFRNQYDHAILMFDFEGSGADKAKQVSLSTELERDMEAAWGTKAAVVVIVPELDVWVWSDSPNVDKALSWAGRSPALRDWVVTSGFQVSNGKPTRPKEALEAALKEVRKPRSSKIYLELSRNVSLKRCTDKSFAKLKNVLQEWFPIKSDISE